MVYIYQVHMYSNYIKLTKLITPQLSDLIDTNCLY